MMFPLNLWKDVSLYYTIVMLHVPSGEETFDSGLFFLHIEDLLLAVWGYCRGRYVPGGEKAGNAGTGGIPLGTWSISRPPDSVDNRRITASIEISSWLLHLWLGPRLRFGVALLRARRAGCTGTDLESRLVLLVECSSLRRTASGNGCEAVLLILAALILACNSSGPTDFRLATGGMSVGKGFEKLVDELGRGGFVEDKCSSDVVSALFCSGRVDIV
jgi:hypothetical protein